MPLSARKQPFENQLLGVVGRDEMLDQQWRVEPGVGADDVFLVVGPRIRPGSLSAWIVAEHRPVAAQSTVELPASDERASMPAAISDIARELLGLSSLDPDADDSGLPGVDNLRRALEAAYRAGSAARDRVSEAQAEAEDEAEEELSVPDALHEWSNRE